MNTDLDAIDRLWARGIRCPVETLEDLDRLDPDEIVAGYRGFRPGDPEPGPNHSRAYWHGWQNRAAETGHMPSLTAHSRLAAAVVQRGDFAGMFRKQKDDA